jgi:hypothetical protein
MRLAISDEVGSRPNSRTSCRETLIVELVHRPHQTDVALLDQVVGFNELVLGLLLVHLALDDFALRAPQFLEAHACIAF